MLHKIRHLAKTLCSEFVTIPDERKQVLSRLAAYIQLKYEQSQPIKLVFICTHNSRRSHFGQIAAMMAAEYFALDKIEVFSGGTESTAFHPNAINALRELGFSVESENEKVKNPIWRVRIGSQSDTTCFSKTFDDPANPSSGFVAVMTCSEAEQNCPYVPGTELRVGTTYDDPKSSDGTPEQDAVYQARFRQIATELLYTFSLIK